MDEARGAFSHRGGRGDTMHPQVDVVPNGLTEIFRLQHEGSLTLEL